MNITEALNAALPEMPARLLAKRYPRIHPKIVYREHIIDGAPVVRAVVPGIDAMFNFAPVNWQLIQLFDGKRSYEEIAELYFAETGIQYAPDEIREMADGMEAMDFWYKTPQEKNIALMQKSARERRKLIRKKSSAADLSSIAFPAWNPDRFLDWLHERLKFIYTGWFTLLTLMAFAFMGYVFITRWDEVARDTVQFYNFSDKSLLDILQFWLLATLLLSVHEMAHGLTCKHYGARVPAMGFLLIYLTPAFFTDTTEGMITGDRNQRLMISISGVWSELMVCALATPVWWGTPPGTTIHNFAYIIILITGIGVVLINWNPLMKLDGYHILSELLGVVDLKENSTAYVSAWVKRNIWRLPVEVPHVPKRRRPGFAAYALLSGAYSYTILYIVASWAGNISKNFSPEWSFVPELGVAALIFKSRIRTLVNFMKFLYLDKKDRVRAWFTGRRLAAVIAMALLVLFLPLWHESAEGRYVLEAEKRALLRAQVPGTVTDVYVVEGQAVVEGAPLVRLRNLPLQSKLAHTTSDYEVAAARATSAQLRYVDLGSTLEEHRRLGEQTRTLESEVAKLELASPIGGIVMTPRPIDILGAYVEGGTELVEVADLGTLRARVFLPEYEMRKIRSGATAELQFDGIFGRREARSVRISQLPAGIESDLVDLSKYKGMRPPNYFVVDLLVANSDGALREGMTGTARLYGRRTSLGGLAWQVVTDFVGRTVW